VLAQLDVRQAPPSSSPRQNNEAGNHQQRETKARSTLDASVSRIDLPTPMRWSPCGSPKIRRTARGVPTSAPRVSRRVAQVTRDVPTWIIADKSISSGLISINVVLYRLGETGRSRLSNE
jgi:hypothetical protein